LRAIQVTEFGGPEVLELREVPEPEVADGLVAIDVSAAGINYADTHHWLARDVHEHVSPVWTLRSALGRPGGR
jgi:NADPH:quinone reductase-like Zn-dependent oxidoreductase